MSISDFPAFPKEFSKLGGAGKGRDAVGKNWFRILTAELGGLKPHERALDAGCGLGRMAVPLMAYLREPGSYDGFDISPEGIAWCQQHITGRQPNFRFQVADIRNTQYNPKGNQKASEYRFPYQDQSFDLVFMASVCTHLMPDEIRQYLSETSRVLNTGGRCVISYFLLNEASLKRIKAGKLNPPQRSFSHDYGTYRVQNQQVPEAAIAHDEASVRELYNRYGLSITEPIHYGGWAARKSALGVNHNQDLVLAIKA
ncbi:MAG: class I SAM-dependent methyltransferase [Gammaproteobacteria bacterium]